MEFSSTQSMEDVARRLNDTKILNRMPTWRITVNKDVKPWQCFVKVGNLDTSTTTKNLKQACGSRQLRNITFGDPSYSSSAEEIGQAIQILLSSVGTVETWILPDSNKGPQIKATASFSTMDQAKKAITDFHGYKLPQLGGSKIFLSHMVKAKFSIMTAMHTAISSELANVQRGYGTSDYLEIKTYPSADQSHRYTILHIISSSAHELGKAKAKVEKILNGHTARGATDIIWHEFFLKSEGMAFLNDLGKTHEVFIYRNAKKSILSLYGSEENMTIVESVLIKTIDDLATSTTTLDLEDSVSLSAHQTGYRRIVERLGKTAVRLNVTTSRKTIVIHGSSQDANWAKAVLQEESSQSSSPHLNVEESTTCAVCWCGIIDEYRTPCGHSYDKECFVNQCLSSGDENIPIRCLGSGAKCQAILPFSELEATLTRNQLDQLLERSFTRHIRTHPAEYQYCSTADCVQVYKVSQEARIFTCATCLASICTQCGAISHEGLTCAQYKIARVGDDVFAEWKKKNDARDCPKCGCTIQKRDGCNHMQCKVCGTHLCWVCMKTFAEGGKVYDHMGAEHGGFYDVGYGDNL